MQLSLGALGGLPFLGGLAAAATRPRPRVFLLNGWVLTAHDMEVLARHDR